MEVWDKELDEEVFLDVEAKDKELDEDVFLAMEARDRQWTNQGRASGREEKKGGRRWRRPLSKAESTAVSIHPGSLQYRCGLVHPRVL